MPSVDGSRCRASRRGRRRRARARPRPRGGTAPPRPAAAIGAAPWSGLVAVAAAVDQVGRAGRPQAGVVEVLEDRPLRPRSGAPCSCCRRCPRASGRRRTRASPGTRSRTRRSAPRRGGTSSSTGSGDRPGRARWRSSRRRRGVTDGNDDTQSRTNVPRSTIAASAGARPSRDRALEHLRLERVDDREDELLRFAAAGSAGPAYFRSSVAAGADEQQQEDGEQRANASRGKRSRSQRAPARAVGVDRTGPPRRRRAGACARSSRPAHRRVRERRDEDASDAAPRPRSRVAPGGERAGEQQRAEERRPAPPPCRAARPAIVRPRTFGHVRDRPRARARAAGTRGSRGT